MPLPPGLAGFVAAQEAARRGEAASMQQITGILGLQAMMENQRQAAAMHPLQMQQLQTSLDQSRQNAQLRGVLMGQLGPSGPSPMAFGSGGISTPGGGQENMLTGQTVAPAPARTGIPGVDPMSALLMLSGDAGMGKLGSAIQEAGKPISTRYGIYAPDPNNPGGYRAVGGAMPPGALPLTLGPDGKVSMTPSPEQLAGVASLTAATKGAEAPYSMQQMDVPVYLPGGDQINVKMNATQAHQYQLTGKLPPEIAASIPGLQQPATQPTTTYNPAEVAATAATMSPQDRAAYMATVQAGNTPANNFTGTQQPVARGAVVGRTQSQSEQITQKRQEAGGKAVDEQFAKDYVAFTQGGGADAAKQLAQLQDVKIALALPGPNLTGPVLGRVPEAVKAFTNPQSIAMKERVDEVVQRSLRAILGAQFTEREGERLIARAYNPALSEKENAIRVGRLFTQLEQAFQQKQDAARYYEKNGTLQGWSGKLPTIADFDPTSTGGATQGWSIRPAK